MGPGTCWPSAPSDSWPVGRHQTEKKGLRLRARNTAGAGSPFKGGHSSCRPGRLLRWLPASSSILLPDSLGATARRSSIAKRDHLSHPPPIPNRTTRPSQATQQRPGCQPPESQQIPLRSTPFPMSAAPSPAQRNAHPAGAGQVGKRREDQVRWWSDQGPIFHGSSLASAHRIPSPVVLCPVAYQL